MGTDVAAPARKKAVNPVYPEEARRAWIQGVVALDAVVGAGGTVEKVAVVRSIPVLDPAAIDAVLQWEYEPVVNEGRAVPVVMTVALNFTLPGAEDWVVAPEGEARLRLEDFFVSIALDGGRSYAGTIHNLSARALSGLEAIVSYRREGPTAANGPPQDVEPPLKRKHVAPSYPDDTRVQGLVIVEATVNELGTVGDIRVLRSIPPLDPAATDAVRQWEYEPARRNGVAVPFLLTSHINFSRKGIKIEEAIAAEVGRVVAVPISGLEPGGAHEFSLSLPPPGDGDYTDVQLRFLLEENGLRRDIPTSRQRKTISSR